MALLGINLLTYLLCFPHHVAVVAALSLHAYVWVQPGQAVTVSGYLSAPCSSPGWPLLLASPFPIFLALHVVFAVLLYGGEELNPELIQSTFLSSGVIFSVESG